MYCALVLDANSQQNRRASGRCTCYCFTAKTRAWGRLSRKRTRTAYYDRFMSASQSAVCRRSTRLFQRTTLLTFLHWLERLLSGPRPEWGQSHCIKCALWWYNSFCSVCVFYGLVIKDKCKIYHQQDVILFMTSAGLSCGLQQKLLINIKLLQLFTPGIPRVDDTAKRRALERSSSIVSNWGPVEAYRKVLTS